MKTKKIKLLYYKYREISIFVFCLIVVLIVSLSCFSWLSEKQPLLSLVLVVFLFYGGYKLCKKYKL